jgi:hypothetical protein
VGPGSSQLQHVKTYSAVGWEEKIDRLNPGPARLHNPRRYGKLIPWQIEVDIPLSS